MKEKIERSRQMSKMAQELGPNIKLRPMSLIIIKKRISYDEFQDCLDIYENNQLYYRNNVVELKKLEKWFSSIREPYPENVTEKTLVEWRTREKNRKENAISDYCDLGIRPLLTQ